ncbi:MAG: hypothetical protein ABI628_02585 [Chloroflexota bacterium]
MYGKVGRRALDQRKGKRATRVTETGTQKRPSKAAADNRWHIAADWVEMFAPVIWDPLEADMRARAIAERARIDADQAAGGPLRNPIIWIADEAPVFGATDELFCVLVVAECEWKAGQPEPIVQLRVARAMPDRTMASWLRASRASHSRSRRSCWQRWPRSSTGALRFSTVRVRRRLSMLSVWSSTWPARSRCPATRALAIRSAGRRRSTCGIG